MYLIYTHFQLNLTPPFSACTPKDIVPASPMLAAGTECKNDSKCSLLSGKNERACLQLVNLCSVEKSSTQQPVCHSQGVGSYGVSI
jgi:hypothetical protein